MSRLALPMFFALSGFLVASSLERTNHLPTFVALRFLRIFPALTVEVILSALVLGPLLTTFSLEFYFSEPEFVRYFWIIVGSVQFDLPGVFRDHPSTKVNASLWTVPWELDCYILLSVLFLVGVFRRGWLLLTACLALSVFLAWRDGPRWSWEMGPLGPGRLLVVYFIAGVVVFKFRQLLPGGVAIAAGAFAIAIVMMLFDFTTFFSPLAVAYATVALGCTAPPRAPVILRGDYSYGMYLYAYPIQQMWVQLVGSNSLIFNFLISVLTTALFAAFSWHCIEKPTLSLKSKIRRRPISISSFHTFRG